MSQPPQGGPPQQPGPGQPGQQQSYPPQSNPWQRDPEEPSPGAAADATIGAPADRPMQPAPVLPVGELPYDAYPAPSGGVFEQASHEPIAPVVPEPPQQTGDGGFHRQQQDARPYQDQQQYGQQTRGAADPYGSQDLQYRDPQYGPGAAGGPDPYGLAPHAGVEVPGFGWDDASGPSAAPSPAGPAGPAPSPARPGQAEVPVQPVGTDVPRHAQLSYTSFDRPGMRGGWQVKETAGALDEAEAALLRDAVQTQFDSGQELPTFPTPEEIAGLPRRLLYGPLGPRAAAHWHTAPAGTDASGRPGNVFAQVLLDRDRCRPVTARDTVVRPIDRWRSPGWRTPFGADEVRAATLPAEPPAPTSRLSTEQVVGFLTDPRSWRIGTATVLLEACLAAITDGAPVVLVTDDVDDAARWITAVSRLIAPAHSHELFFSTLDRATGVAAVFARGVRLACIPRQDAEVAVRERDVSPRVVLATGDTVQLGDRDGAPHRTGAGDEVIVTAATGLVTAVLADPTAAVATLDRADAIAAEIGSTTSDTGPSDTGHPLWSLALAVAERGTVHADGLDHAAAVLTTGTPAAVLTDPAQRERVERLVADHLGPTTADAWQACGSAAGTAVAGRLYLLRAVGDLDWLTRPEGVQVPDGTTADAEVVERARGTATALRDMAAADPRTTAVATLRLAELTAAVGIDDPELTTVLRTLAGGTVMAQLAGDTDGIIAAVGPIGEATRRLLVAVLEADRSWTAAPVGSRLPRPLLRWLFPDGVDATLPTSTEVDQPTRLRAEVAAQLAAGLRSYRGLPAWVAFADDAVGDNVRGWFAEPWPLDQLVRLQEAYGDRLGPDAWLATLKTTDDSAELQRVCERLGGTAWQTGQPPATATAALAGLRMLRPGWSRLGHRAAAVTTAINGAAAGQLVPDQPFATGTDRDVQLAVILAIIDPSLVTDYGTEQRLESLRPLFEGQRLLVDTDLVNDVSAHLGTLDRNDFLARLARADPVFGHRLDGAAARIGWLEKVRTPTGPPTHGARVLRAALRAVLGDQPDRRELTTTVREAVRRPGEDQRAVDKQVDGWVAALLGTAEPRRRGLFRGGT